MFELYPVITPYVRVLEEYLRLVCQLWLERVDRELQAFAEALDQWLHDLFEDPTPDWRESFEQLLAEQEAEGRTVAPESRQELLDFLERWAAGVDWNPQETGTKPNDHPRDAVTGSSESGAQKSQEPRGRFARRKKYSKCNEEEAFFFGKLASARGRLDEMRKVLEALGHRLDGAKLNETVEVEQDVDRIEELIWLYHDDLESAQDAWLRNDLSRDAIAQLHQLDTPGLLGLPRSVDAEQSQRIISQGLEISRRLAGWDTTADRLVLGMRAVEWTTTAVGIAAGGGVLVAAAKKGGKWAVIKTIAVAGAVIAAEQGLETGLRAAGASETVIRGARLAAAVVSFIIARRKSAAARTERPTGQKPTVPKTKAAPQREKPSQSIVDEQKPEVHTHSQEASPQPPSSAGTGIVPKATTTLGEWGEIRLKQVLGGRGEKPKKAFSTSLGPRYSDRMVDGVSHEAKAGIDVGLTNKIETQILKDVELIANGTFRGAHWHFFQGAEQELLRFLKTKGIQYTVH